MGEPSAADGLAGAWCLGPGRAGPGLSRTLAYPPSCALTSLFQVSDLTRLQTRIFRLLGPQLRPSVSGQGARTLGSGGEGVGGPDCYIQRGGGPGSSGSKGKGPDTCVSEGARAPRAQGLLQGRWAPSGPGPFCCCSAAARAPDSGRRKYYFPAAKGGPLSFSGVEPESRYFKAWGRMWIPGPQDTGHPIPEGLQDTEVEAVGPGGREESS